MKWNLYEKFLREAMAKDVDIEIDENCRYESKIEMKNFNTHWNSNFLPFVDLHHQTKPPIIHQQPQSNLEKVIFFIIILHSYKKFRIHLWVMKKWLKYFTEQ